MAVAHKHNIVCRLKQIRIENGLTQIQLAALIDVKRQAIYDMEAGKYLPNTAVALSLAEVLNCRVEDIFAAQQVEDKRKVNFVHAVPPAGARISVAKVRGKLFGYPAFGRDALKEQINAADGLVEPDKGHVRIFKSNRELDSAAMLLGCDPAFSLIEHHILRSRGNQRLQCRFASSKTALDFVSQGKAHIAGTHFHDTSQKQANVAFARKKFSRAGGKIIAFSSFEEGLMVQPKNPKQIRGPADLADAGVRTANREKGAALRTLFDDCLKKAGIAAGQISGYDNIVYSHAEGARQILYGRADAALGLRIVAEAYGLDFIPMAEVRCDLVIPADLLEHPAVKAVLDALQTRGLQKELESLPGYDAACTGNFIADL